MSVLVIVNQIDVRSATVMEGGSDSPETRDAHGPETRPVSFQRVQSGEAG